MSVTGRNTLSLRKKDLVNQTNTAAAIQRVMFAHKATAGDTGFNVQSLVTPSDMTAVGFVQPSVAQLLGLNLFQNRNNLKIISSARGVLMDYISYSVASTSQINFTSAFGSALADEVFICYVEPVLKNGSVIVDADPVIATGTLLAGNQDILTGTPYEAGKWVTQAQIGAVMVFVDGVLQFRNVSNATASPSADGNYQEVDAGGGISTVIRMNTTEAFDRSYVICSNGLNAFRPTDSVMAAVENVAGQMDKVVEVLAVVSGQPESYFQTAPNSVDLKQFGEEFYLLKNRFWKANVRSGESGSVSLLATDNRWQSFSASAALTVVLPSTDIKAGDAFRIENRNATNFQLTLQSSGLNTIHTGIVSIIVVALQDAPTTAAHWAIAEISAMGTFTMAESSKSNLTGTGSFGTGKWVRNGNHVRAYNTSITGYSVTTAANTRTFVIVTPTGLPGAGADITNSASGNAWAANASTDLACMARVASSGTNFIVDWTALSNYGTGAFVVYNLELTYQIG